MLRELICKRNLVILALFCLSIGLFLLLEGCTQTQTTTPSAQTTSSPTSTGTSSPVASPQLASMTISKPANGNYFAVGEQPVLTITLKDATGKTLSRSDDFSQLRLMAAGPIETTDTVTAVKLLKTTDDRKQAVHHYIDLTKNTDVQVTNGVFTYKFAAVSDEKPGTYTVALWAVLKTDGLQQALPVADFQIGTANVEKQIVGKENCAVCHLGASTGKIYMAHIDPGFSPTGNWALDSVPVQACKTCHNNNGYSAYTSPTDSTVQVSDAIVKRVHGVHMGEGLTNTINTDPKTGIFKQYSDLKFPLNVENCVACHTDDRWKTKPSKLACGACHDNTWFGDSGSMPKGMVAHQGGPQGTDAACAGCHPPDTGGVKSVSDAHKFSQPLNKIDVSLTPAKNGKFYTAGEKPVLTLVIKDDKGNPIDQTKVDETTFATANFYVYGPRDTAVPVLTNAAKNGNSKLRAAASSSIAATGTPKVWNFADGDTFKIAVNGGAVQDLKAPTGAQTPDQVRDWLKPLLKDATVTSNAAAGSVTLTSNLYGDKSELDIYNGAVTTKMGWKPGPLPLIRDGVTYGQTQGTTVEPFIIVANASTNGNDLRPRTDPLNYTDPLVVRTQSNITYQLDDVAKLQPGTYMVFSYTVPNGVLAGTATSPGPTGAPNAAAKALNESTTGIGFMTFQVGTETPDKKIATNCNTCHGTTIWHLAEGPIHPEPFDTDYCLACHDYNRSGTGDLFSRTGGNSTSGWAGYGAKPIVARVHGVHRGRYLDHPEYVYAGNPNAFNGVIFPQDIRNCEKCHDPKTTLPNWKDSPNRLACTACHDSDAAIAHTNLMTDNPTPSDPYGPKAVQTCNVCHGVGREFAVDKVHNITTPFKPPYPREPAN